MLHSLGEDHLPFHLSGRAAGSHYGYSSSYHHKASGPDSIIAFCKVENVCLKMYIVYNIQWDLRTTVNTPLRVHILYTYVPTCNIGNHVCLVDTDTQTERRLCMHVITSHKNALLIMSAHTSIT